ncbi:hypothetical protein DEDE109153_01960 [Deinococcus deserti]
MRLEQAAVVLFEKVSSGRLGRGLPTRAQMTIHRVRIDLLPVQEGASVDLNCPENHFDVVCPRRAASGEKSLVESVRTAIMDLT